jgi:hypothetical protein
VKNYFVIVGDVRELLGVQHALTSPLAPMMHSQMLDDCSYYLVVLFFGRSEIRPSQVLQLRHNSRLHDLAIAVFVRDLEPALDQVGHEALNGDKEHLFIIVKGNSRHRLVLPDLLGPVLVALDFGMFFQVCQHDDE